MAIRELPDGRWICYFKKGGVVKKKYFGRGAAGRAAAERHDDGLNLRPRERRPQARILFADLAQAYAANKPFNANSLKMLHYRLMAHILPILGNKDAARLCDEDLDDYVQRRRAHRTVLKRPTRYSTIRREIHDIKAILNWAAKRRPPMIIRNPVAGYPAPAADDDVIMPPSADETERILAAASEHLRRAVYLAYFCGMRPGAVELLQLTWQDVNWPDQTIRITAARKGGPLVRLVPMHKELYTAISLWYKTDEKKLGGRRPGGWEAGKPIVHYKGRMIKSIQTSWEGALKRAGIKRRIRPYDLRHHFVTRALEAGMDMKALSEVVGSRPETLMKHYQHVTRKMHRQVVDSIPSLGIPSMPKTSQKATKAGSRKHLKIIK